MIAAIDVEGRLVSFLLRDFSIKTEDVVDFLAETSYQTSGGEQFIFLDNLRAHHSKKVAAEAAKNSQTLLFNGGYSS